MFAAWWVAAFSRQRRLKSWSYFVEQLQAAKKMDGKKTATKRRAPGERQTWQEQKAMMAAAVAGLHAKMRKEKRKT